MVAVATREFSHIFRMAYMVLGVAIRSLMMVIRTLMAVICHLEMPFLVIN